MAEVGFVGLGALGGRMTPRLVAAGHDVKVWNRTAARADGYRLADSPAELAREVPVVFGCLFDDDAVERVYLADDGLLAGVGAGSVLIEHGTFSPALAERIASAAADRGAVFLDVPVTGGPEGAEAGTLVGMAGGAVADLDRVRPILAAYLGAVHHVGPIGAGLRLKLVNQLLVSVHMVAAAEAGALLLQAGADARVAQTVLGSGWAASAMLDRELPRILAGDHAATGAAIGGLLHVQQLVADAFAGSGVPSRLLPPVRAVFAEAVAAGLADDDPAALVRMYEEKNR